MFWSFATLIAFLLLMYAAYRDLSPKYNSWILGMAVGGLVVLAVIWRLGLKRKEVPLARLILLDRFYAVGTGMTFGAAAFLSRDLAIAPFSCLLYTSFMVLLRAIVVPSTGARTAILGSVAFAPIVLAAIGIWLAEPLTHQPPLPLPGPAYVGGAILVGTVAVMLATVGSRIIYGLRRQVTAAMQLGQYTLLHKIGEGGMGSVYRARHAMLRRPTAVKLVHPNKVDAQTLDRFEREVQHMSLLTHPNTVAVYDYGRSPDGVFYYAMEFLDGINLESLVARYGPQPFDRVVSILTQVAGALAEAHGSDLIHRDIKPANIILCERGGVVDVVKVVDFGLVKEITAAGDTTSTKSILGTPAYIAPEAVTDPDFVGTAVDLYALGAVGYFLLTGKKVFDGKTPLD
ncbi:MAG: serine/threonine protein kinase, partial [Deltaproteobacteria bacterium]|nr:serine/threonine protein kinase [Deltaproteobacteria bacterium]